MREFTQALCAATGSALVLYLGGAFSQATWDIAQWGQQARSVISFVWVAAVLIAAGSASDNYSFRKAHEREMGGA